MMRIKQLKDYKEFRNRHLIVSVIILSVIAIIIMAFFRIMYTVAKQKILNVWENNVIQLAKSTEYYLARPADAVEFSAVHVEDMIAEGRSNKEIGEHFIREMANVASLVENNYTGVYGYCRGDYLDASGWVPDKDYEPTQRPWYIAAKANKGKVTLVSPFLNLQTKTMMMSISKLLRDGESVLSIDIFMDGLQKTLDDLAREEGVKAAFILDSSGNVVVHSRHEEMGKNYLQDGNSYQKELAERVRYIAERKNYYDAGPSEGEIIFAERINNTWCAALILNEANLLSSVRYLNSILFLILVLLFSVWYGITKSINRKYREAERLYQEIHAVADIYDSMTLVDLKTDQMTVLTSNDKHDWLLEGNFADYSKRIVHLAERMSSTESRDMLIQFMDPATYEERLQDARAVSYDFLNNEGCWLRNQLIMVDRDAQGKLWHIIWAVESIDRERKQQEHLRKLAETDALSGLYNRRTGEARIRTMLASISKGMFVLLDIDDFKIVNDRFGHAVGDAAIVALANALRKTFRDSDIVFRLGGDEFAVFVPGIEQEDAKHRLIQRLHHEISCISIPEMMDSKITVSVGMSDYSAEKNDTFETLYLRSDQNMYDNKKKKHGV